MTPPLTRPGGVQPVLDVQDLLVLGPGEGLLADLVILGDLLLVGGHSTAIRGALHRTPPRRARPLRSEAGHPVAPFPRLPRICSAYFLPGRSRSAPSSIAASPHLPRSALHRPPTRRHQAELTRHTKPPTSLDLQPALTPYTDRAVG